LFDNSSDGVELAHLHDHNIVIGELGSEASDGLIRSVKHRACSTVGGGFPESDCHIIYIETSSYNLYNGASSCYGCG
jgi:hypothetical protein